MVMVMWIPHRLQVYSMLFILHNLKQQPQIVLPRGRHVGDSAYPAYSNVSLFHLLDILTIFRSLLLSFDTYIYCFSPYCTSAVDYDYTTDRGAYTISFLSLTYFLCYIHIAVDTLTGSVYNTAIHYDYVTD